MRVVHHVGIGGLTCCLGVGCTFDASGGTGPAASLGAGASSDDGSTEAVTGNGTDTPESETTGGPAAATTGDTDGPSTEHLQHTAQTTCDAPLWCSEGDLLHASTGAQMAAECFTSSLSGPLGITRFHFVMPAFSETAVPFVMRVWSHTDAGPGATLHEQPLVPATMHGGSNELRFDPPLVVEGPSFCIGFDVPAQAPAGAIGFAVDSPNEQLGISYTRFPNGSGSCDLPDWIDLAEAPITPPGTWCFDVDVTANP